RARGLGRPPAVRAPVDQLHGSDAVTRPILFLTIRMGLGFGVAVAVEQLARRLQAAGVPGVIGTLQEGDPFDGLDVRLVSGSATAFEQLVRTLNPAFVIANTSPFFEMLPVVADDFFCIAWEYGDPSPAFFDEDRAEREQIIRNKRQTVYPCCYKV